MRSSSFVAFPARPKAPLSQSLSSATSALMGQTKVRAASFKGAASSPLSASEGAIQNRTAVDGAVPPAGAPAPGEKPRTPFSSSSAGLRRRSA
eukprot:5017101-Alexandrium_andersonii.AAC.1